MTDLAAVYDHLRGGRADEARSLLGVLLDRAPQDAALHRARALLAQHAGREDEALDAMRLAGRLAPDTFALQMELGQLLAMNRCEDEAVFAFTQATRLRPDAAEPWYLLGMSLYEARRDAEALPAFMQAHALSPDQPMLMRALAETHYALEQHAEALALYARVAADVRSADSMLCLRRAQCLRRTGAAAQALVVADAGVADFPDEPTLWLELGWIHEDLGDAARATAAYERAHALHPGWGDPLACLLALQRERTPGPVVRAAETLLADNSLPEPEQAYLHYVLGKRDDARGAYDAAANHWTRANALRRRIDGAFDRAAYARQLEQTMAAFDHDALQACAGKALHDTRPLFVLGMPRSGTTLVEQILASHPMAHGCGELTGIASIAQALASRFDPTRPRDIAGVEETWLRDRAARYLDEAAAGAPSTATRLVDKQPYNVPHVGLLSMLFADARIVWCRRDPRDVALSMFSESFAPSSLHATDLEDIRCFMEGQERLMRHWQAVSPLPILEVRYESLVADTEAQVRQLLAFAGLPWHAGCLDFHDTARQVQTLSRWQVRQPIHSHSVGRWRRYPRWFDPDGQAV